MIIYKDAITGDEILSDTYKLQPVGKVLWEVDCKKYVKGKDNFQLESANPSAEGGDDAGGDDAGDGTMVHDIEENFQLNWLKVDETGTDMKPSKEAFRSHLKSYIKNVNKELKSRGASEETISEFQAGAPEAMKKILGNYDNYDVLMGSSMDATGMHVLIDFRDDGMTPFATVWKHGLVEEKV